MTGASSGIGLEIARGLARHGDRVVLLCRDAGRAEAAVASIREDVPGAALEVVLADLSLQSEVRSAAAAILDRCPRLHVLVNNAGVYSARRRETAEVIELQLAVNHLAPFLLTRLLEDRLAASAPSRIVNVVSSLHRMARLDMDDLQAWRSYRHFGLGQYAVTKLLAILATRERARRLGGTGVAVNCVHPGGAATNIWPAWQRPFARLFMASPAMGAMPVLSVAADPAFAEVTGAYVTRKGIEEPSPAARDPDLAARAWAASEAMCGLAPGR
ncbi:MAG: SDR family oxidoreductase [Deltaproteobacteria bacterium]|nr:SDR family oxidoreductase [Deltaproteobacteria bacterium]